MSWLLARYDLALALVTEIISVVRLAFIILTTRAFLLRHVFCLSRGGARLTAVHEESSAALSSHVHIPRYVPAASRGSDGSRLLPTDKHCGCNVGRTHQPGTARRCRPRRQAVRGLQHRQWLRRRRLDCQGGAIRPDAPPRRPCRPLAPRGCRRHACQEGIAISTWGGPASNTATGPLHPLARHRTLSIGVLPARRTGHARG